MRNDNKFLLVTDYLVTYNYVSFGHFIKTYQGAKTDHLFNYQICCALDLGEKIDYAL